MSDDPSPPTPWERFVDATRNRLTEVINGEVGRL
jgi:hypothetical protein